jgi:hypothetical protein
VSVIITHVFSPVRPSTCRLSGLRLAGTLPALRGGEARPLLRFFYSFLRSRWVLFWGRRRRQALVWWPTPPRQTSRCVDGHGALCALAPYTRAAAVFWPCLSLLVVSSRRLQLVFRASVIMHPASVFYIEFVVAVLSKVAGAPTAPARQVSVASLFRWGEGGGDWVIRIFLVVVLRTLESVPAAVSVTSISRTWLEPH